MPASEKEFLFAISIIVTTFLILLVILLLFVFNYNKVRKNKEAEILKAIYKTQESERTRIAEDLHDDIGAKLSAVKLYNHILKKEISSNEGITILEENNHRIQNIISDLRIIARNQASRYIIDYGLIHEVEEICQQVMVTHNIHVSFTHSIETLQCAEDFEINLFIILQELLHNSVKHSKCSEIKIIINANKKKLIVKYYDNGIGFVQNETKSSGMGLNNIEARVKLFYGTYKIKTDLDRGLSYTLLYSLEKISALDSSL